jgi:hypothetical protein
MDATSAPKVTVVQPGEGESVSIPGFGAVYKLYSRDNGGEVAIVEHPFAVGYLTAPLAHAGGRALDRGRGRDRLPVRRR